MTPRTSAVRGTNPLHTPHGGGGVKKGQTAPLPKPFHIDDYDFSDGEPMPLTDPVNLSGASDSEDVSQSMRAPSLQPIHPASDDGSRDADSASEDSDFVTPPANTPPGPAQPTVQLSDDPAIAALQKSTLAATTQVVLYAQCLAILDNALADPQCKLPPNSFSYLKGLFGGAIKECEGRAQELTTQTEQLLAQHSEDAKALAAQADGDALPAADDTFSVRPNRAPVDTRRALREVKQLPKQAQQDQILKGLRVARKNIGHESDAEVDRDLEQLVWDLDNPTLAGVDPELGELYKQLQVDAELDALEQQAMDMKNIPFTADHDDVDLDNLAPAATNGSVLTPTASQQPADLDAEQNALLAEVKGMLSSADSKSSTSAVSPPQIPLTQHDLTKPVNVSPDELLEIDFEGVRSYSSQIDALQEEIAHARNRKFTSDEEKDHQKFLKTGGSSAEFRKKLVKPELLDIVRNFQAAQDKAIDKIQVAIIQIGTGQLMSTASQHDRQLHLARLKGEKGTCQHLIDASNRMTRSF